MSNESRLLDYIDHIRQAATDALGFVEDMDKSEFLADKRTQQAVSMSFIIMGEAAAKVLSGYTEFTKIHPEVPWLDIRGMRNRLAHDYFEVNLDVVWTTVQKWLPELLNQLSDLSQDSAG